MKWDRSKIECDCCIFSWLPVACGRFHTTHFSEMYMDTSSLLITFASHPTPLKLMTDLTHLQDGVSNFSLQRWKSCPVFCLLHLLSWALSTFFGVKCGELSTWEEMKHVLDRYKLMLILNSYRWCQTSIWCSHAVFTHKFRISLSQGSVLTELSGEEQRTAATVTEHRASLWHFAQLGWVEVLVQNVQVALSAVANTAKMLCYFIALLCTLKPQWLVKVLTCFSYVKHFCSCL